MLTKPRTLWVEVTGAYGRQYTTLKAAKADFEAGKDFQMTDTGQYISKSEAERVDAGVVVRYGKNLTKTGRLL